MMDQPDPCKEAAVVGLFLQLYASDRERGEERPLAEYQERFAGFEAAIAKEYAALKGGARGDEANVPVPEFPEDATSRFRVGEEIARGGMGVIYRVWDRDLRRSLAMKALRAGKHESSAGTSDPHALQRFLQEARITGQLEHPGIVPVHALGLDPSGRVYFIMSMIEGEDLAHVVRRVRDPDDEEWTLPRAVEVIQRVCDAVAFAHDKGVVHRDLKPSNVRIGRFGEAYVMDWGLARALDDSELDIGAPGAGAPDAPSERTLHGDVFGTPSYMAPEQARGDIANVGYRSDVYAIGAMLYELLSGAPPYESPDSSASSKVVLERVLAGPPAPLPKDVPLELAAVCEQAMARSPEDRYPTVLELGRDLRAFLEQRVVHAYEVGAFAELRKWVKRNKALSATGMFGVLALVVGLISSLYFANEASAQAAHSQSSFELASKAIDTMLGEVGDKSLRDIPQMTRLRERLLTAARDLQLQLIVQRGDDPLARLTVGEAHLRLGRVHNLIGEFEQAESNRRRALELFESLVAEDPTDRRFLERRAEALCDLGRTFSRRGETEESVRLLKEAEQRFRELHRSYPDDARLLGDVAKALDDQAAVLQRAEEFAAARDLRQEALIGFRSVLAAGVGDELRVRLGAALRSQALLFHQRFDSESGLPLILEAVDVLGALVAENPAATTPRSMLASAQMTMNSILRATGDADGADKALLRAIETRRELASRFPGISTHHRELAGALHNRANTLRRSDGAQAYDLYLEALGHQRKALAISPEDDISRRYLTFHLGGLVKLATQLGDHQSAVKWATEYGVSPAGGAPRLMAGEFIGYSIGVARADKNLSEEVRAKLIADYEARLQTVMRDAVKLGVRHGDLVWSSSFDPLRSLPEYPEWLAAIELSGTQADREDRERTRYAAARCLFGQTVAQIEALREEGWRPTTVAAEPGAPGTFAVAVVRDHADTKREWWWQHDADAQAILAFGKEQRQVALVDLDVSTAGAQPTFAALWIRARRNQEFLADFPAADLDARARKQNCRVLSAVRYERDGKQLCAAVLRSNILEDRRQWGIADGLSPSVTIGDDWSVTSLFEDHAGESVPICTLGPPVVTRLLKGRTAAQIEAALAAEPGSRVTTIAPRRDVPGAYDVILLRDSLRK